MHFPQPISFVLPILAVATSTVFTANVLQAQEFDNDFDKSILIAQEADTQSVEDLPVVVVLATGGTIAGTGDPGALTGYSAGSIEGSDLVNAVPEILNFADVRVEQIANVGSSSLGETEILALAKRANELLSQEEDEIAGIVVTHGTTSLEETAFFLNLTVKSEKPVIVVGAQRPATAISADGPLNLLNAVRAAADPDSRGRGTMVIMNDQINAARDVMKTQTFRVETFQSGEMGFLGYVDPDAVVFYRNPINKRHTIDSEFDISDVDELPKVGVVFAHQDADGTSVEAFVNAGYDGIILYGFGTGNAPPIMREAIFEAAAEIPVVTTAHTSQGRMQNRANFDEAGIITADNLQPKKARILLQLALLQTDDHDELLRIFSEY
jgi:L-asparaginase